MADSTNNIKNSWGLVAFARMKGKMQLGTFTSVDKTTGETQTYKSCIFTDPSGNRTFARFSSNLGEMTSQQIIADKDNLQIVERTKDNGEGTCFILCKQGANSWEDVELF